MNPIIAILQSALSALGLDPSQLIGLALHEGLAVIHQAIYQKWLQSVPAIAAEMAAQGWTLQSTSPERPAPPQDYVGRVQYKCWDRVVPGGALRDWLRDSQNRQVTALVADQLDPTDHEHNVRAIIEAEITATFGAPPPKPVTS